MGLENVNNTLTLVATETMTASQFRLVKLVSGTDFGAGIATAATDVPGGVQQGKAASGAAVTVAIPGAISKVTYGGNVNVGDKLTATTGGKAIATTTDKNHYWGIALQAGVDGDIGTMLVAFGMVSAS